ncbi:hypothetical protein ACOMHN_027839 [Nucella lapillus]
MGMKMAAWWSWLEWLSCQETSTPALLSGPERQWMHFKDYTKEHLQHCGIPSKQLAAQANDRSAWRAATGSTVSSLKDECQKRLTSPRDKRKTAA